MKIRTQRAPAARAPAIGCAQLVCRGGHLLSALYGPPLQLALIYRVDPVLLCLAVAPSHLSSLTGSSPALPPDTVSEPSLTGPSTFRLPPLPPWAACSIASFKRCSRLW